MEQNINTLFAKPRYSNVLGTCFFNPSCIAARNQADAAQLQAVEQQQSVLMNLLNQSSGGLKAGAIIAIFLVVIGGGVAFIYFRRKREI